MPSRSLGHRAPVLWLVLPLLGGLVAGECGFAARSELCLALALAAATGSWFAAERSPAAWAILLTLALGMAGSFWHGWHRGAPVGGAVQPPREFQGEVRVNRVFLLEGDERTAGIGTVLETDDLPAVLLGARIHFSAARVRGIPAPLRSSVVRLRGVLVPVPADAAVGSFEGYLASNGVRYRVTRGRLLAELVQPGRYWRFCEEARIRLAGILSRGVDAKRPGLTAEFRAMMLGQQYELTEEQTLLFRRSGTLHIFSISGMHIMVIATGLNAGLLLLRLPRWPRCLLTLGALWLYVCITGLPPSAVRAFVMLALLEFSQVLRRPANPVAALAVPALLTILIAPLQVFGASFQLSYGIVAALILLGLPLADAWQEGWSPFRTLPSASWRWWHHAALHTWRYAAVTVAIGVSTTLASTISGIQFFGLFTPGGLVVNLALIPASSCAILAGFCSLVSGLPGLAGPSVWFNHAAIVVLWLGEAVIRLLIDLPGLWLPAAYRWPWLGSAALPAFLALLLLGYARGWNPRRCVWLPFALVAGLVVAGVRYG